MLGMLLMALADARHLFTMADLTAALSIEGHARLATGRSCRELHAIRPHPGQAIVGRQHLPAAAGFRHHGLATATTSSTRCRTPTRYGCAPAGRWRGRDTLDFARPGRRARTGVHSWTIRWYWLDGRVLSTGNFHGAPLGFAADYPGHRRRRGRLDLRAPGRPPARRDPVAPVCRRSSLRIAGVNSGLMIAQYTAAGIVAENRRLASPAWVDSVPTSGMQEDHVSMGWAATRKLRTVLDNVASLLAVELLAAPYAACSCARRRVPRQPAGSRSPPWPVPPAARARTCSWPPSSRRRGPSSWAASCVPGWRRKWAR